MEGENCWTHTAEDRSFSFEITHIRNLEIKWQKMFSNILDFTICQQRKTMYMNRSRHSCCLSNILNIKSRCFVRSRQCGSNNKSFLVWHHWVTPIQSHGVFVLTSWHQPPLTNKKALLSWHHKMTSPLSNQEAHLWWRHSAPIKRTSHTIFFILKVEDGGGGGGTSQNGLHGKAPPERLRISVVEVCEMVGKTVIKPVCKQAQ